MKDPFAVERALAQSKIKQDKTQASEFMDVFSKPLMQALRGDLEPLIKANRGTDGKTPVKGTDYFTSAEIENIRNSVLSLIPPAKPGKDAEVNYDLIFSYVVEQIAKLPKPKDGENGKDAVIDYAKVVSDVLKQIPKTEKLTIDYTKVEELIDKKVKRLPWQEHRVVGYSSLRQLTDVILTGVPQDTKGNYILTPGAVTNITGFISAGTNVTITGTGTLADPYVINATGGGSGMIATVPTGLVNGSNTSYTSNALPKIIVTEYGTLVNQAIMQNAGTSGFTYTGTGPYTITVPLAPNNFIFCYS
jgi:hypothetical protein